MINWKAALIVLTCATATAPSFAQTTKLQIITSEAVVTAIDPIKGLVAVERRGKFHHTYKYQTEEGRIIPVQSKIKGVKDLRPLAVQHPIETPVRAFCAKWNGTGQMITNLMCGALYTAALFKL